MDSRHKALVKQSWARIDLQRERLGELFYNRLFALDPALRPLFKGDMQVQGQRLLNMLDYAVAHLDAIEGIMPDIEELGRRHAGYGVRDQDYQSFEQALIWTLQRVLGPELTPEVEESWCELFELLAGAMKRAAARARQSGA